MTDLQKRAPGWAPDLSSFGARLALLRQAMGWGNVKQAAELCGIPVETWRTWERDGMTPRNYINACMKIAGVTGVDINWLAVGPGAQPVKPQEVAASTTLEYRVTPLGERVVAVGSGDLMTVRNRDLRAITRTRPIRR